MKPLLLILACLLALPQSADSQPQELDLFDLGGLSAVYLSVDSADNIRDVMTRMIDRQYKLIESSMKDHGIDVRKSETDIGPHDGMMQFMTNVIEVPVGGDCAHYMVRLRFELVEFTRLHRDGKEIQIPAITWQRSYPATFFNSDDIPRYIEIATENMLIEFEHDLIDGNPMSMKEFEKREFVR